jgi:hypothetical protein
VDALLTMELRNWKTPFVIDTQSRVERDAVSAKLRVCHYTRFGNHCHKQYQRVIKNSEDISDKIRQKRNNVGLKKLFRVLSEQTSDSSAFLNARCLLKYVFHCERHFSYFDPD